MHTDTPYPVPPTNNVPPTPSSLKELEEIIRRLNKENFSLKLRIFYLEERMGKYTPNDVALIKENVEQKVLLEETMKELEQKAELLVQAREYIAALEDGKEEDGGLSFQDLSTSNSGDQSELVEEHKYFREQVEEQKRYIASLEESLHNNEERLQIQQLRVEELDARALEQNQQITILMQRLKDKKKKLKEQKKDAVNASFVVKRVQEDEKEKDRELKEKGEEIKQLLQMLQEKEEREKQQEAELLALQQSLNVYEERERKQGRSLLLLEEEMKKVVQSTKVKDERIQLLEGKLREMEGQKEHLEEVVASLEEELKQARKRIEAQEATIRRLEKGIERKESERNAELMGQCTAVQEKLNEALNELESKEEDNSALAAEMKIKDKMLDESKKAIHVLEGRFRRIAEEHELMKAEMENKNKQENVHVEAEGKWKQQIKERDALLFFTLQQLMQLHKQFSSGVKGVSGNSSQKEGQTAGLSPTGSTTSPRSSLSPFSPSKGGMPTSYSFAEFQEKMKEGVKLLSEVMNTRLERIHSSQDQMQEVLAKYKEENESLRRELANVLRIYKQKKAKERKEQEAKQKRKELKRLQKQKEKEEEEEEKKKQEQMQQKQRHPRYSFSSPSSNGGWESGVQDMEDGDGASMNELLRQAQLRIERLSENNRVLILELEEKRRLIETINRVYKDVKLYANTLLSPQLQQSQQKPHSLLRHVVTNKENRENEEDAYHAAPASNGL